MNRSFASLPAAPRKGSVLLIVIGLLLMLMLLGFTFFTFASLEEESAKAWDEAAKADARSDVALDSMWQWSLQQLITGTNTYATQSALDVPIYQTPLATPPVQFSSRYSMIGNMFGNDMAPYTGSGIHLMMLPNGAPAVDQNYNGVDDSTEGLGTPDLRNFNISPPANFGSLASATGVLSLLPAPDVDYTYPDINNLFLAYVGTIHDQNYPLGADGKPGAAGVDDDGQNGIDDPGEIGWAGSDDYQRRVIIPSFHRPQLLRDAAGFPFVNAAVSPPTPLWAISPTTTQRVFRPHPQHVIAGTSIKRFLSLPATNAIGGPVAPFPFTTGLNGQPLSQGVFDVHTPGVAMPTGQIKYNYDCDNDGDGEAEGVLIDLGYPPQKAADGRTYIPLFSFTVIDGDGLINVNTAGNLYGLETVSHSVAQPFGWSSVYNRLMPVSRSNLGIMPSEINPVWALNAHPVQDLGTGGVADLKQYKLFFGNGAIYPQSRADMGNMDYFNMLMGRGEMVSATAYNDLIVGRWGDRQQLQVGIQNRNLQFFPRPGQPNADDNGDAGEGEGAYNNLGFLIPNTTFRTPLDYWGSGARFLNRASSDPAGKKPQLNSTAASPARFMTYSGYHTRGNVPLMTADNGNLMWSPGTGTPYGQTMFTPATGAIYPTNQLTDDPAETIVEPKFKTKTDEIFAPEENEGLHRSPNDADYSTVVVARLNELLPYNFGKNKRAAEIRGKFITDSWDRTQFNFPMVNGQRFWEFNADVNGNAVDVNGDGLFDGRDNLVEYPPVVAGAVRGQLRLNEPFRPELRKLLEVEKGSIQTGHLQFRFNLNAFLTSSYNEAYPNNPTGVYPTTSNIRPQYQGMSVYYRGLTAHPADPGSAAIPTAAPPYPSQAPGQQALTPAQQEFWARRDRQQMARDIYVMLYMLGGGDDSVNYATASNASNTLYSIQQTNEMAQFAVNLVDALDRDNVFTAFEFDRNLANGWNLDDDPYHPTVPNNPNGPSAGDSTTTGERGVVYGVEAQQLTLSEALCIKLQKLPPGGPMGGDNPATAFDDTQADRFFMYLELANAGTAAVDLTSQAWRVRLEHATKNALNRNLLLKYSHAPATGKNAPNKLILPNDKFTIGTAVRSDGTVDSFIPTGLTTSTYRSADFRLDLGANSDFDRIIPLFSVAPTETTPPKAMDDANPATNLDLVHDNDFTTNHFAVTDDSGTAITARGGFLPAGPGQFDVGDVLTFTLWRRLHPTRTPPTPGNAAQEADNPWVKVDDLVNHLNATGTRPVVTDIGFKKNSNDPFVPVRNAIVSTERAQPLDRSYTGLRGGAAPRYSIGAIPNSTSGTSISTYDVWQPHFDRDFASAMDLLSIPLYGPDEVTRKLAYQNKLVNQVLNVTDPNTGLDAPSTAQARFLRPQHSTNVGKPLPPPNNASTAKIALDNRWYRLFEFVEVPSRMHRQLALAGLLKSPRVPGKLNLNTIRHREVLAALLDDPFLFNGNNFSSQDPSDTEPPPAVGVPRNWWLQFTRARDGRYIPALPLAKGTPGTMGSDPITGLYIPGMAGSQPFRGFSQIGNVNTVANTPDAVQRSLDQTILRRLPLDLDVGANSTDPRHLFEVGNAKPDHQNDAVDFHTRQRLLSKIHGNTTTRSHVFVCWVTVQFHEAVENGTGNWQVGAPMGKSMPNHRLFSIIDRSPIEKAYNPQTGINYKSLVLFQRTIE